MSPLSRVAASALTLLLAGSVQAQDAAPSAAAPDARRQTPDPARGRAPYTLDQLIARARRNDPRVRQVDAQVEAAKGKQQEVWWAWLQPIEYRAGIGGPTPESKLLPVCTTGTEPPGTCANSLLDTTPGTREPGLFHGELGFQTRVEVSGTIPLFTFGKLTAGRRASEQGVLAQEALRRRAKDQAAFDVIKAFWGYQASRGAAGSIGDVRSKVAEARERVKALLAEESDQVTKADAQKIEYAAEEIEAQHASALKATAVALAGIRALTGVSLDDPLDIAGMALPEPPPAPDTDALLRKAMQVRPEAVAAAANVAARRELRAVEKGTLFPDIGIVGGFSWISTSNANSPPTPFAFNPYNGLGGFVGLGLRGTLDIPTKLAKLRQADAAVAEAEALQRGAEQLVRFELQSALADLAEARTKLERYTKQAALAKQMLVQAALAFDSGLGDARDVFEGVLLFGRSEGEKFSAQFNANLAWASVQKAVGDLGADAEATNPE